MFAQKYHLILFSLIFGILKTASLPAQDDCYVQLDEASGFDVSPYQAALDAKACELKAAFQDTAFSNHFKVYGFGFYVNLDYYDGYSYPQAFQDLQEEVAAMSPYYLLIGRQSDRAGVFSKFWVDVELPETGSFNTDCLNETARILLTSSIGIDVNQKHNQNEKDPTRYYEAELLGMDSLIAFIEKVIDCCDPETRTSCNLCSNSSTIMDYFLELGFDTYQYKVIGPSNIPLPAGQNKVEDFANLLVEVDGDTVNLAEVFLEGISSTFLDSLNVKVLFTKDTSFCNEDFIVANNIWAAMNFDFIQWMHFSQVETTNENSFVLVNIKENLLNVVTEVPRIEAYLAPPDSSVPNLFDLNEMKLVIANIYQKNNVDLLNISILDKEPLGTDDLWLTVVYSVGPMGNSDLSSSTVPPTTQKQDPGSWVNLWRVKDGRDHNEEYYNYRMGYIAAHEFLHQILIKAFCYINTLEGGDPYGFDVSINPFRVGRHYNSRINLLSEGGLIWNRPSFPQKRTNELIPEEIIITEYHALIWHYRIIRYLENTLPPSLKKAYFPIWAEYWRKFLKDTDFFPVK